MSKLQHQIDAAIRSEDYETVSRLVNGSIRHTLNTRLTKRQLSVLEAMKDEHGELLDKLLSQAFRKGWAREGKSNLSNAMNDVLQAAQTMVQAYRLLNEGMTTQGSELANTSTNLS